MLFGKKKTKDLDIEFATTFKKERLSAEALDHFAEAYALDSGKVDPNAIPYILRSGEELKIDRAKIYLNPTKIPFKHFEYLFGQTLPYHRDFNLFGLRDLMFIVDENNKPIPWTNDKKAIMQFMKLADALDYLIAIDGQSNDPKNILYGRLSAVKPVIHTDKEQ